MMNVAKKFNTLAVGAALAFAPLSPQHLAARQQMAVHDNRAKLQSMVRYYRGDVKLALCAYAHGTKITDTALSIAIRGGERDNWLEHLPLHVRSSVRRSLENYQNKKHEEQQKKAQPKVASRDTARSEYLQAMLKYYNGNVAQATAAFDAGTTATNRAIEYAISDKRPLSWSSYLPRETQDAITDGMSEMRRKPHLRNFCVVTSPVTAFSAEERAQAQRIALRALTNYYNGNGLKALAAYHGGLGVAERAMAKAEKLGNHHNWIAYMPSDTQAYVRACQRKAQDIGAARKVTI